MKRIAIGVVVAAIVLVPPAIIALSVYRVAEDDGDGENGS